MGAWAAPVVYRQRVVLEWCQCGPRSLEGQRDMEDGLRPEQGRSMKYRVDARREEERIMGFAGDGERGKEEIGMPWTVSHQSGPAENHSVPSSLPSLPA